MAVSKAAHRAARPTRSKQRAESVEEAIALGIKRNLASELATALRKEGMSQSELARRMRTSRAVVHRLLKADDPSVTLATLSRAAVALGRKVKVTLKD
jgi:ribosome-binding protein aMBF1 (putative translation factor)